MLCHSQASEKGNLDQFSSNLGGNVTNDKVVQQQITFTNVEGEVATGQPPHKAPTYKDTYDRVLDF